ncbi:MAG: hypothetical protein LC753_09535 [Acidobacteria bacterium]|nr:hypothetical protein [Acidobacteriota bacterium]MCA1650502.1 hypothetical protein [Acidobacteriota bacterium]
MSIYHLPVRELVTLAQAAELGRSFVARNRTRHALAHPGNRLVSMMPDSAIAKHLDGGHWPERGIWHFSRPAYSRDGHALVYLMYHCGPAVCGSEWLFILQRAPSGWTVKAAGLLSMS